MTSLSHSSPWTQLPAIKVSEMGHLFVVRGDLTKFACDAIVLPCDEKLNVNDVWLPVLPAGLARGDHPDWVRIAGTPNAHRVIDLPHAGKRSVWAFVSPWSGYTKARQPVDRLWAALVDISNRLVPTSGRARPLIGIPLVGTGDGGLAHQRGEVISELLHRHRMDPLEVDLALVLFDRRDFAAVQNYRDRDSEWPELDEHLLVAADRLGALAAKKELSLFLGSGVSRAAGLPDWPRLLELLADEAGIDCPSMEGGFEAAATPIKTALGNAYESVMSGLLDVDVHAVGHGLLAGLQVDQMITTNFDPCMELALEATKGDEFRVLVRQLAEGGMSWLLKLHGDIREPESLILDKVDVSRHVKENGALRGVVQGLLLTSHLLFVGFSFRDEDFLELADSVAKVRNRAGVESRTPVGTALALTRADAVTIQSEDLDTITMPSSEVDEAARLLEIFLDRLAWAAATNHDLSAEYLLDDRYASGLSDRDRSLRNLLLGMAAEADRDAKSSPAWMRVASCLRDLGATVSDL